MNSPCNTFARARPLEATPVTICSSSTVPHFCPMSVVDHLPNNFLGYLLDGEKESSLTSHVERTRAL
jgi:hypothetical protein